MKRLVVLAGVLGVFAIGLVIGTRRDPAPIAAPLAAVQQPIVLPHASHVAPSLPTSVTPGLLADLRDPDPKIRRAAVADLSVSEARDPQLLLAASHDGNVEVAIAATEALGPLYRDGRITAQDLAARITDRNAADKVRVTAINSLGLVPARDSAAVLVDLLAHGDANARRSAAILLVHQDRDTAVPALIGALADGDELVRSNAHDTLHQLARGRDFGLDAGAWQRWWQSRTA
jgi:HEAT repeat protein